MQKPFGTYSLSPRRAFFQSIGNYMPNNRIGKWGISLLRRLILDGGTGPFDISVGNRLNLRLYPTTNLCEKRALCGVHIWNCEERAVLDKAFRTHTRNEAFTFLDIGANVGFYSLFLADTARDLGRKIKIIAVEPDKTNAARLNYNAEASGISLTHNFVAIGGERTTATLTGGDINRGEVTVTPIDSENDDVINVITLHDLCQRHDILAIDAMKVDIEGHDFAALKASCAEKSLYPKLLIAETGRGESDVLNLCLDNGYELEKRVRINSILRLK